MKKILCSLFIVSLFAVSFAEEFDMLQYRELVNAANKARKEGNSAEYVKLSKQARTYLETTDLATDAASQNVQLAVRIPLEFQKARVVPSKDQIDAKVNERFTAFDDTGKIKANLRASLYSRYRMPEALVALEKEVPNDGNYAKRAISMYTQKRMFTEALKLCDAYEGTESNRFNVYKAQKDGQKIWALGKSLFLDTYVPNANTAMTYIKEMFNKKPASVKDEQVVELLTKIGEKYPTPGTDFETWKGFMGFIGYKYKTITGKDLFKSETASK